jgi:hypothetical protein
MLNVVVVVGPCMLAVGLAAILCVPSTIPSVVIRKALLEDSTNT